MTSRQQWAEADTAPWTKVNETLDALDGAYCYAQRKAAHSGLTVAYGGGTFDVNTVADGTVSCTDNTTNYIVAHRSTRAVSTATSTTNWNDTTVYGRVARAVFASGVLTYHDERFGVGGIFDHASAGGYQPLDSDLTTIAGLTATTDNFIQAKSSAWASRTVAQVTADLQGTGLLTDAAGFRTIPQNSQSAAYTTVAADSGKHLLHPSGDANARTFTINSNANVAYPVGTAITFVNMTSQVVTIAITSDTLYLAGAGTTGSRSLAQYGVATALKLTSTTWIISGTGIT